MTIVSTQLLPPRKAAAYIGVSAEHLYEARCEGLVSPACVCPTFYEARELDRYAERYGLQRTRVINNESITVVYDE